MHRVVARLVGLYNGWEKIAKKKMTKLLKISAPLRYFEMSTNRMQALGRQIGLLLMAVGSIRYTPLLDAIEHHQMASSRPLRH